jgi:hypothetical protein
VNTTQVIANWLIGREIVEEEQHGQRRAGYGQAMLQDLSARLQGQFGGGYSVDNLEWFRAFYLAYPGLLVPARAAAEAKSDAARRISEALTYPEQRDEGRASKAWQPGRLHPHLSWTHYRR